MKFKINGETHYGWAVLNVKAGVYGHEPKIKATLLGYAYETVAGQGLRAGEGVAKFDSSKPGSQLGTLAMLALAAPALNLWRREDGQE